MGYLPEGDASCPRGLAGQGDEPEVILSGGALCPSLLRAGGANCGDPYSAGRQDARPVGGGAGTQDIGRNNSGMGGGGSLSLLRETDN